MTKLTNADVVKARAEAIFGEQRIEKVREAAEVAKTAEAEKIARLRSARLAKEELERKGAEIRKARRQTKMP